jgi:uncharacterized phage protein gp47/JayE
MSIIFNPQKGIITEDTALIRQRRAAEWKQAFAVSPDLPELNTDTETPAGQLVDGETALISQKDSDLLFLARMFDPVTSLGIWQDALARIYFISRQRETPTYVTCQCTGLYGATVPYGAIVQDTQGHTFINTAPAIIGEDGRAEIIVRCSEWGPVEVGAGAITKIITTVPGWDTVGNAAAGLTGRYEETRAEFENRRFESVAKNSHGAAASVFGAVANVENVIACRVLENPGDDWITKFGVNIAPHSLYISVYGGEDGAIARALYLKLDGGCGTNGDTQLIYRPEPEDGDQPGAVYTYYIKRPAATPAGLTVNIRRTPNTPANIADIIREAIITNWEGKEQDYPRVGMAETLYASRFYKTVISVGVDDLINIQASYPAGAALTDSAEIPADQMPTLDRDNIIVNIAGG